MNWLEDKYEMTVAAVTVVIICACVWLFAHFKHVQEIRVDKEISFEMPRPKAMMTSLFDLIGREIDRQFVNPFAKPVSTAAQGKAVPGPVAPPTSAADVMKKAAQQKKKKSSLSVDVVDTGRKGGLAPSNNLSVSVVQNQPATFAAMVVPKKETTTSNNPANTKEKERLSPGQWRALILNQPSQENVLKLVSAYQERDLDSASFYAIIGDLLKTNKAEAQTVGIYALRVTPSATSFSTLIHANEVVDATLQASVNQAVLSYGSGSYVGVLGVAIVSKDTVVAAKAMEMISANVTTLKSQLNGKDQTSKDPEIQKLVVQWSAYKSLAAALKQVAAGTDQQLAQQATAALTALNS